MSLILEALRKSEAERRRGRMPDLHAELPPAPAPRAATKPAWPWLAGSAALVTVALVAWLAFGPRAQVAAVANNAPVAVRSPTPAAALAPVPHLQPAVGRATVRTATAEPVPRTSAPAPGLPQDLPRSLPPPSPVATAIASAPAPAPSAQLTPRPLPLPPPPASTGAAVLTLADLAPDERKALPPLKLSMHMWNDDAAQRFVILDGNRFGEGDRVGDAVITAITRDGVLLDWNGRALKITMR